MILSAITGSQAAVLSGHTGPVKSLAFSSDGTSLVSGSDDKTVKFWDVQTGGVVKTFHGHTKWVTSVSISADCTMIASGSNDSTIHLWDTQTGECHHIIEQSEEVTSVNFSPSDPQRLISTSHSGIIQWWDVSGHPIGLKHEGSHVAFSPDGTHFISHKESTFTIQKSDSGVIVAKFCMVTSHIYDSCFSPDGRLIAIGVSSSIYIWDIAGSDPHCVRTLIGHTLYITSLAFSSFLISASGDNSVKFWQTNALATDPPSTSSKSTPLISDPIKSTSLQANDGIAISSDLYGVVKTWDISTGCCIRTFQTPAIGSSNDGIWLISSSGAIFIRWADKKIHVWDTEKGELQTMDTSGQHNVMDVSVSGDGSRVFCLGERHIQAWSIQTGEVVSEVKHEGVFGHGFLTVGGSRVWAHFPRINPQGWEFGNPGSSPVPLSSPTMKRPHLHFIDSTKVWNAGPSRVQNMVTGKEVLRLPERFAKPSDARWDGQYLVAGYKCGDVLILDFTCVSPH